MISDKREMAFSSHFLYTVIRTVPFLPEENCKVTKKSSHAGAWKPGLCSFPEFYLDVTNQAQIRPYTNMDSMDTEMRLQCRTTTRTGAGRLAWVFGAAVAVLLQLSKASGLDPH